MRNTTKEEQEQRAMGEMIGVEQKRRFPVNSIISSFGSGTDVCMSGHVSGCKEGE